MRRWLVQSIGPTTRTLSFLCIVTSDYTQLERENIVNMRADAAKRLRGFGKSIARTTWNLRTIVVESLNASFGGCGQRCFATAHFETGWLEHIDYIAFR